MRHADGSLPLSCEVMLPEGATSIRSITGRHSLFPSSSAHSPIGLSRDSLSRRESYGFTTFPVSTIEWVRSRLSASGATSAIEDFEASTPGHLPFWPKPLSTFGLAALTTFISDSLTLTVPFDPSSQPPWCWQLQLFLAIRLPSFSDEATLFRRLRTPPLSATHAPVGYRWQNTGLHLVQQLLTRLRVATEKVH